MDALVANDEIAEIEKSGKNDFLLITPLRILPTPLVMSLGAISVYSYAKEQGFDGDMIDFNAIITEDMIDRYDEVVRNTLQAWFKENPDVYIVGINVLFSGVFTRALEIVKLVKELRPDVKTAIGGIHATIHHKEISAKCEDFDHVVIGEGERQFVDLLKIYSGKNIDEVDFSSLQNGVTFKADDKVIIKEKTSYTTRRTIQDLGKIDYSSIDFTQLHSPDMDNWYNPKNKNIDAAVPIITSRSCPFSCNFCSIHAVHGPQKTFRYRPSDVVMEELKFLHFEKGVNYFYIIDDCSTCNKKKTIELYTKIAKSDLDIMIEFGNGLSIRTLDKEVIDCIVEAGMVRGGLAIESGSEFIRNQVVEKGLEEEKIFEVYDYFRKKHRHVWLVALFILGLPEETEQTLEETLALIQKLEHIYPVFNTAVPTPGTRLWDQCVKDDLLLFEVDEAWKDTFVFSPRAIDGSSRRHWTMEGLKVIDQSFVIQPYNLDLDTLFKYYTQFQDLRQDRLENNFYSRGFSESDY